MPGAFPSVNPDSSVPVPRFVGFRIVSPGLQVGGGVRAQAGIEENSTGNAPLKGARQPNGFFALPRNYRSSYCRFEFRSYPGNIGLEDREQAIRNDPWRGEGNAAVSITSGFLRAVDCVPMVHGGGL